jgi:hypothetical protein
MRWSQGRYYGDEGSILVICPNYITEGLELVFRCIERER